MPRNSNIAPTVQPSARARGGAKKVAPAPELHPDGSPVQYDAYGNKVPQRGTPEFSAWHAGNLEAQKTDTRDPQNALKLQQADAAAALQASEAKARANTAAAPKPDTSGQFGAGTIKVPTVAENLAKYSASLPKNANSGFSSPMISSMNAQIKRDPATGLPVGMKPLSEKFGNIDLGGGTVKAPSKVETAADQAQDALGPVPQVDRGLADRRLGEYQEALGMSREVIDRLLNGPNTADRIGSQTLRSQLALARSAAGGPGAVAAAFRNAQNQAPELQAQATEQARAEELQRVTAAGNVASNFAQAALGARGQDVDIAKKNTDAGLAVKNMVAQLTGTQLELDQRNQELIGQMARDVAAMEFDWAKLSVDQQNAAMDRYLQLYGVDANIQAQLKAQREAGKLTAKDWLGAGVGLLGAAGTVVSGGLAG
jgi:hypothetical protein